MRTKILFFVVLGLIVGAPLGCVVGHAQVQMPVGATGELQPLIALGLSARPGYEACGLYFTFTKVGKVMFVFEANDKDGVRRVENPTPEFAKLQVRVVDGLKHPTAKVLHDGGPVLPWYEIAVSPADFKSAPCLSYSPRVPAKSAQ